MSIYSEEKPIVSRQLAPASVDPDQAPQQERATYSWFVRLWHSIRGYTASDIARVKEAGVRLLEGESDMKAAEARRLLAEAENAFAEAELKKQQARVLSAEADSKRVESEAARLEAVASAMERFSEAVSRVRQQGGDVSFDSSQIKGLILQGLNRYPHDSELADAAEEIQDEERED